MPELKKDKKYAFVAPRCGSDIAGGAEALMFNLALQLKNRGYDIEIIATCAKDNRSWENYYPEGQSIEKGLCIRRFLVNERNLESWIPKQLRIQDGFLLSVDDQLEWLKESVNSDSLYEYIAANGSKYEALFFGPYMFGTTFWGSQIHPHKSFLFPCLHAEIYAELDVIQVMMKNVAGLVFNANAEKDLAESYYGELKGAVVGLGFDFKEEVKRASYFQEVFPYIVYLGRKETGKNVQTLVDYFIQSKNSNLIPKELKLVVVGPGDFSDLHRPNALDRDDIIDIKHVTEEEKEALLQHSLYLCQPSLNESFSIVLMEAWLQEVPVLVHSNCAVTKEHVLNSGGGLYFDSVLEFAECTKLFLSDADLKKQMGKAGKDYVKKTYNWPAVIERFERGVGGM